jgi:hypothetical protein
VLGETRPYKEIGKKIVYCTDKGCIESVATLTPWQQKYTHAETTMQQAQRLHKKTDPYFVEEEVPFRNRKMFRRE